MSDFIPGTVIFIVTLFYIIFIIRNQNKDDIGFYGHKILEKNNKKYLSKNKINDSKRKRRTLLKS